MLDFVNGDAWPLIFWGAVALLGAIEFLVPRNPRPADRARRWPTNLGLGILNGFIASLLPVLNVSAAQWAAANDIGFFNRLDLPWWLQGVSTVLAVSGTQYALHRCFHANALMWRVHRAHHSDVHLDVTAALRFHPGEMIAGVVVLVPIIVACGLPAITLAVYEVVQILVAVVTHANLRVPAAVERIAGQVVVTPGIHHLHHSADPAEFNRNFGNVFVLWDQLFRTYDPGGGRDAASRHFGLKEIGAERARSLIYVLALPWRNEVGPSATAGAFDRGRSTSGAP